MSIINSPSYETIPNDDKVKLLEEEILALNRAISFINQEKLDKIQSKEPIFVNEGKLEIFADGSRFVKCIVTKHDESEFIDISFIPVEGKILQLHLTEKSYKNFIDIINRI